MVYEIETIYEGSKIEIGVLKKIRTSKKEDCQVLNFLEGRPDKEYKKVEALITMIGDHGLIRNKQKLLELKGKKFEHFYELKSKPLRIFAIYLEEKRQLVLLEALLKKAWKLPVNVYKRIYKKYRRILNDIT